MENFIMSQPQRLEIKFFGTVIRAEGIVGVVGTIAIVGAILATYFRS
jgi:hypothetical protein